MISHEPKILIIDDDPQVADILSISLENEHFAVSTARSGEEGLRAAFDQHPDLILLDISMPGMDGFQVLDHLRVVTDTPVIFLTAMSQDANRIRSLEQGAADFIPKGTKIDVILATIQARLHPPEPRRHNGLRRFDAHLQADLSRRRVWVDNKLVALTPLQWRLFECLLEHEGRIVTLQTLLNAGWKPPYYGDVSSIKVQISLLRKKIQDTARHSRYIHNVREEGYMFEVRSA